MNAVGQMRAPHPDRIDEIRHAKLGRHGAIFDFDFDQGFGVFGDEGDRRDHHRYGVLRCAPYLLVS